jgi:RNA polymerase sigma-70 factor (ECF subfamily)
LSAGIVTHSKAAPANRPARWPGSGGAYHGAAPARRGGAGPHGRPSMEHSNADVTQLLRAAASGERGDLDALMAAIYADLRRLAVSHMRAERDDHTLQPTALVHEAYIKLIDQRSTEWKDRVHFFAVASRIIRRILVDHAREHLALKRGGGRERVAIDQDAMAAPIDGVDVVALDEALAELAAIDERQAKIVELRFFGGLTIEEIAELLSMGKRSVDREWQAARAWLFCRLAGEGPGPSDG